MVHNFLSKLDKRLNCQFRISRNTLTIIVLYLRNSLTLLLNKSWIVVATIFNANGLPHKSESALSIVVLSQTFFLQYFFAACLKPVSCNERTNPVELSSRPISLGFSRPLTTKRFDAVLLHPLQNITFVSLVIAPNPITITQNRLYIIQYQQTTVLT